MKRLLSRSNVFVSSVAMLVGAFCASMVWMVHLDQIHMDARQAFEEAQIRMEAVTDKDDMGQLITACNRGDDDIHCRQDDYDITYRGHKYRSQYIAIDYYRSLHGAPNRPYITATVHIERQPRVELVGSVVN
jgi:hypothetical protein